VIRLEKISKRFGSQMVFRDLDLTIQKGIFTFILGPSGTGKSVLLKHIIGLLKPDSGRVYLEDRDITDLAGEERQALMRRFGFVFQQSALFDSMNVFDNLAFGLRENGLCTDAEIPARVARELERVELGGIEEKMPAELSGGMEKRIGLARATIMEPEIILYDEPTAGLDPVIASTINDLIRETAEKTGATQVVVTHDMESAYRVADRIAMLFQGRIIEEGGPAEIRSSANPVVRQFVSGNTKGPITDGVND
jgi:phospholipid/cholesterol/gamma-HCH transport system ATP-binding protein